MNKLIIACDPDVDGKGFAIYEDGVLTMLCTFGLMPLHYWIDNHLIMNDELEIELHIEDLMAIKSSSFGWKAIERANKGKPRDQVDAIKAKYSERVGRCKQMQLEVEKIAEHFSIKIVRHKVSSKWKDKAGKKEFERVTGWTGRSNADARSAAWMGYQGLSMQPNFGMVARIN